LIQQNAYSSEEMASTAEELSSQSEMLTEMVAAFVVENDVQYYSCQAPSTSARNLTPQLHFKHFDTDLSSVRKNGKIVDVVGIVDVKDDDFEQY
jgi:hypothetical protein